MRDGSDMEYRGTVRGGVVVLEPGASLREGSEVRVRAIPEPAPPAETAAGQTLGQRLMRFAGKAQDLSADAARNHDHYLYGTPKR